MGSKYTFSPHLVLPRLNFTSSFLTFLHPPQWAVQGGWQWNSGQFITMCAPFSSHFSPAPAWVFSMALSWTVTMSFPPGKFFKTCCSACAFHGVWSFRNRLLLMGLLWDSVLSEELLLCGFLHRLQCVYLLWCGPSWPAGEQPASPWSFP